MKYLLDSNAVIGLLSGKRNVMSGLRRHGVDEVGISAIVMHELYFGADQSNIRAQSMARIDELQFAVVPYDRDDAREAGVLRAILKRNGTPIDPYDILIAGQARARDLILVTHNTSEFSRVSGLRIADWEA